MKIFETNSALGYNEVAYFIESKEGYLCIYENETDDSIFGKAYNTGEMYEMDLCKLDEVIESKHFMVLDQSPLKGTFLFNYFLKGFAVQTVSSTRVMNEIEKMAGL